mmetsp:Transcript_6775/g.26180  ORF Transcript_6775/g.26180 Transcript_6775/m.26180 type:complete len:217 (+) Transcript_6775:873-1523(+)
MANPPAVDFTYLFAFFHGTNGPHRHDDIGFRLRSHPCELVRSVRDAAVIQNCNLWEKSQPDGDPRPSATENPVSVRVHDRRPPRTLLDVLRRALRQLSPHLGEALEDACLPETRLLVSSCQIILMREKTAGRLPVLRAAIQGLAPKQPGNDSQEIHIAAGALRRPSTRDESVAFCFVKVPCRIPAPKCFSSGPPASLPPKPFLRRAPPFPKKGGGE